jgi:hypothetical protein
LVRSRPGGETGPRITGGGPGINVGVAKVDSMPPDTDDGPRGVVDVLEIVLDTGGAVIVSTLEQNWSVSRTYE